MNGVHLVPISHLFMHQYKHRIIDVIGEVENNMIQGEKDATHKEGYYEESVTPSISLILNLVCFFAYNSM